MGFLGVVLGLGVASATGVVVDRLPQPTSDSQPRFPIRTVPGRRYLVDASGKPFLLHGDSPWSLLVQATREETELYLEDRRSRGFNTILTNLLEHHFAAHPPANAYGALPFRRPGDFGQPSEEYFAHVEWVLSRAASKGLLVLLTPAYLGAKGGNEGWYQEMIRAGPQVLAGYGRYLAKRFRSHDNLIWVNGGDFVPPRLDLVSAVASAIEDEEPKWLHTYHARRGVSALVALSSTRDTWLRVNTAYANATVLPFTDAERERSSMPFFLIESVYEGEGADGAQVRRQAYQAVLSGASGHLMGNRPVYDFSTGWQSALDSPAARTLPYLGALFGQVPWWNLVPVRSSLIVDGRGPSPFQAVAGLSSDRSVAVIYLPRQRTIRIDLGQLRGSNVDAEWFDPTNGSWRTAAGSPFRWGIPRQFRSPGRNSGRDEDWVLVLRSTRPCQDRCQPDGDPPLSSRSVPRYYHAPASTINPRQLCGGRWTPSRTRHNWGRPTRKGGLS